MKKKKKHIKMFHLWTLALLLLSARVCRAQQQPDENNPQQSQQQYPPSAVASNNNNNNNNSNNDIPDVMVLLCTQSFTGEELVEEVLLERLYEAGYWNVQVHMVDEVPGMDWTQESELQQQDLEEVMTLARLARVLLVVASTYADGDPPNHAHEFADWLAREHQQQPATAASTTANNATTTTTSTCSQQPQVGDFAVFGLGDSSYQHYNAFAKFVDSAFASHNLGGTRLLPLHLADDLLGDVSGEFRTWSDQVAVQVTKRTIPRQTITTTTTTTAVDADYDETMAPPRYTFSSTGTDWRRSAIQPGSVVAQFDGTTELLDQHNATPTTTKSSSSSSSSRSVLHVSLSLPTSSVPAQLQAGDHVGIHPRNDNALVNRALEWLDIQGSMKTRVMEKQQQSTNSAWTEQEITARELLTAHVDLAGRATPSALRALLPFVGTLELRALARDLTFVDTKQSTTATTTITTDNNDPNGSSHHDGMSLFDHWLAGQPGGRLTKLDLAIVFECRPSLQALARVIGPLQPRLYSVATVDRYPTTTTTATLAATDKDEPTTTTTTIGICLSVAQGGLCSGFLSERLVPTSPVTVFFRTSRFHLVANDGAPNYLVAAGSGVGPYVGFLEQQLRQLQQQQQQPTQAQQVQVQVQQEDTTATTTTITSMAAAAPLWQTRLAVGCRSPTDILYQDRLATFERHGAQVHYAFSRLFGQPKVYAQDLLKRGNMAAMIWNDIFAPNTNSTSHNNKNKKNKKQLGRVYVCGRLELCTDVRNALIHIAQTVGGLPPDQAVQRVHQLEHEEGRFLTDCWSVLDPPQQQQQLIQKQKQKQSSKQQPASIPYVVPRLARHHSPGLQEEASQTRKNETTTESSTNDGVVDLEQIPAWPSYLRLLASGELQRRVDSATSMFSACVACGRYCEVDRLSQDPQDWGECRVGQKAIVSAVDAHFGEETVLKGVNGSGTIFFGACNLKCMYCQNWKLSMMDRGNVVDDTQLAEYMLALQRRGCHNINLVSPTHNVLPILRGILIAAQNGLKLPIVWNTGGYDSVASLRLLEGIIDIYMPDSKYASRAVGRKLSKIDNYPEINQAAIKEMHRQVGDLQIDPRTGLAWRGLLIRHLILPQDYGGTYDIATFLANEVSSNTYTNVMDYYRPEYEAKTDRKFGLARKPTKTELLAAHKAARRACLQRLHDDKMYDHVANEEYRVCGSDV